MAKFKSEIVHVQMGVPIKVVDNNPDRVFLRLHNANEAGAAVKIDGTQGNVGPDSANLHPGEYIDLPLKAANIEVWAWADQNTCISVMEVIEQ